MRLNSKLLRNLRKATKACQQLRQGAIIATSGLNGHYLTPKDVITVNRDLHFWKSKVHPNGVLDNLSTQKMDQITSSQNAERMHYMLSNDINSSASQLVILNDVEHSARPLTKNENRTLAKKYYQEINKEIETFGYDAMIRNQLLLSKE